MAAKREQAELVVKILVVQLLRVITLIIFLEEGLVLQVLVVRVILLAEQAEAEILVIMLMVVMVVVVGGIVEVVRVVLLGHFVLVVEAELVMETMPVLMEQAEEAEMGIYLLNGMEIDIDILLAHTKINLFIPLQLRPLVLF
jgi:hypothetical protein